MPLQIELKPNEKIFINGAVLANGANRSQLVVLNDAAILRERDILTEERADTPCKRIYLALQLMYMDLEGKDGYLSFYEQLASEVLHAAPSTSKHLQAIAKELSAGRLYKALKNAKALVEYEQELVEDAGKSA